MNEYLGLNRILLDVGEINVKSILNINAKAKVNEHFRAKIRFNTNDKLEAIDIEKSLYHRIVKLYKLNEIGEINKIPLFSGIIEKYKLIKKGIYFEIEIEIVSGTILLDIEEKSRSFQDINMTYNQIIKEVLKDTERSNLIFNKEDKKICKPIIQYEETNWEFIKRLASHFNTYLIPETNFYLPRFYFGLKKGEEVEIEDTVEYEVKLDNKYYDKRFIGNQINIYKKDFGCYEIKCGGNYEIGDNIKFKEIKLKITEKETYLEKGILINKYKLSKETLFSPNEYYNKKFIGLNLEGTILETNKELIKVHLDIDKYQDINTAYFYTWRPETGNLMYLMPEAGTRVRLKCIDEDERNAILINATNEENFIDENYNKRRLTTNYKKHIFIHPEKLEFICSNVGHYVNIKDEEGINVISTDKIEINAGGKIYIEGDKKIYASTPKEMKLNFINEEDKINFDEFEVGFWK